MKNNVASALSYLPEDSRDTIDIAYKSGFMPTDENKLSSAILSHFRIKRNEASNDIQDADFGLYNRLKNAAFEAKDISSLITLADTKKYTTARIRRVIWYSFFGVTSSDVKELPKYTQVLAMNAIGQEILKSIKKSTGISIITKPSSYKSLNEDAKRQKELSDIADSVYQLAKPICPPGNTALRSTPFVQK